MTVEEGEWRATLLAFTFFFFLLASYFILRSIRDALGVQAGVGQLPYLFTGTLLSTLALQPISASLVAWIPVRRFIPIVYRAFGACLLFFAAALTWWTGQRALDRTGVLHLDERVQPVRGVGVLGLHVRHLPQRTEQATVRVHQCRWHSGAMAGSGITALLAKQVGTASLLLISFLMLEITVQCVRNFPVSFRSDTRAREKANRSVGGGTFTGITHVVASPYMLMICAYMMLFTIGTTVLYFQQAEIVKAAFADRDSRTAFLARIDFTVQSLTVIAQLFLTGRLIKWLGVGVALAILPLMSVIGFTTLGIWPTLRRSWCSTCCAEPGITALPARPVKCCSRSCRRRTSTKPRTSSIRSCTGAATRSAHGAIHC